MTGKWRSPVLAGALIIFGLGFFNWLAAHFYKPVTPKPERTRSFNYSKKETTFPLARYQVLLNGSLFFGVPITPPPVEIPFTSKLIIWGIINGKTNRAVVSLNKNTDNTVVVKPGDRIEGEYIKAVGEDFIIVRNQSGEGKIYINK